MNAVLTNLVKVLVKQFYIVNASFFIFFFFIFFGAVRGDNLIDFHVSLMNSILSSPGFTVLVCVAWFCYNLKCIVFCTTTINNHDHAYLVTLGALPLRSQWLLYSLVSLMIYLPVAVYSVLVIGLAFIKYRPFTALLLVAFQLGMILFGAAMTFLAVNQNRAAASFEKFISRFAIWKRVHLGYYGFLLGHIFYERKIALLGVKIFSILLMTVSFIRNGDHFDKDLFSIFFQFIFAAHAILVFYCVEFTELQMPFYRNLPITLTKTAAWFLLTYCVLLLPDLAFMIINNNGNMLLSEIFVLYGTFVSILFFYTAILYGSGLKQDDFKTVIFIFAVVFFFLQKTGFPILIMVAMFSVAALLFKMQYYLFEKE